MSGLQTGLFLFFFPLIVISFFLIGIKEKKLLISYSLLPIILLSIAITTDYSLLQDQPLKKEDAKFLFWETILSLIVFTGYSLYSIIDINEKIEMKLLDGRANLHAVFNNGLLNIVFLDRDMKIKNFNDLAKENVYNIIKQNIQVGDNFLKLVLENDRRYFIRHFREAMKGKVIQVEENIKLQSTDLWYEMHFSPTYNDENYIDGIIFSSFDITERKKMEINIRIAKNKAEAANFSKSHFLSSVSQGIRTPMNEVIGITGLLLEKDPRKDQVEKLKILKSSAENFLVIINDILDFNQLDSGKFELDESKFNLHHLLSTMSNFISPHAMEKRIEFVTFYDENIPSILLGDSVRLSQIIMNLIGNAIKHTQKGKITFEARLEEINFHYTHIAFSISDTGSGIEEENIDSLFENFDRAYSDNSGLVAGSGLGLVITKRLLDFLNTAIFVESELGKGSKFSFTIKFKNTEETLLNRSEFIQQKLWMSENKLLKGKRLLLVEDFLINQIVVAEFLSKWEIELDIADNGIQALEKTKYQEYDIILMDLQMPEMDGYQTTRIIRSQENPKYANIPIIAMTASPESEIQEQVFEAGMNDFITKPFDPDDLFNKILKHVKNKNHST
jgi:signal transduction histidine kinase/CheY-like chemotaxis protein